MLRKRKYLWKRCLFVLLVCFCPGGVGFAQKGHPMPPDTAVSLGKRTYIHFQAALLAYQYLYGYVVKGGGDGIGDVAQNLIDAARQGIQTEAESAGQNMFRRIIEAGEKVKKAKSIQDQRAAFSTISDVFISYFGSWPNQLIRNRLKVYRCKGGHQWLQPENSPAACPYSARNSADCLSIIETKY